MCLHSTIYSKRSLERVSPSALPALEKVVWRPHDRAELLPLSAVQIAVCGAGCRKSCVLTLIVM
eukprot:6208987-Pleurochrysis_carterae.AAC.1